MIRKYKRLKTFCPYPWINLNSNTDGNIKLCCSIVDNLHLKDEAGNELNFGTHSIEEIWNSSHIKKVRQQMLEHQKPKECEICWKQEEANVHSSRFAAIREYRHKVNFDQLIKETKKDFSIEDFPVSLELRLGNLCNLQCNSCWSLSSNKILSERKKILASEQVTPKWLKDSWQYEVDLTEKKDLKWYETEIFKRSFQKLAPNLKRLYLTGGEPTLIKQNLEMIEYLLEIGNLDVHICFTTNLTYWNDKLYNAICQFHSSEVQVSIDGHGALNEFIRYPSEWATVEKNFRKLLDLPHRVMIKLFSVVQIYNALQLHNTLHWINSLDIERPFIFAPINLQSPEYLSTSILPHQMREEAIEHLCRFLKVWRDKDEVWVANGVKNTIAHLRTFQSDDTHSSKLKERFIDYTSTISNHRKISQEALGADIRNWAQ